MLNPLFATHRAKGFSQRGREFLETSREALTLSMPVLKRYWFLLTLASLIAMGMAAGMHVPRAWLDLLIDWIAPSWTTFVVLFLMSFSLDSGRLFESSFRRPGPFLWASLVNSAAVPLLTWAMMPLQRTPDFAMGLMIAGSVPCTLATASVWTRKARGNDAVTLLTTLFTSATGFVVAPFWLDVSTGSGVQFDGRALVLGLLWAALAPTLAGQGARLVPGGAEFAGRHRRAIGGIAQGFVLALVFVAACRAGEQLAENESTPGAAAVLIVWASCLAAHAGGMAIGVAGARWLRFRNEDVIAVAFAGSQKTLPIGLLIATAPTAFGNPDLLGPGRGVPFAVFPMLMFHATQLVMDTAVAQRLAAGNVETTRE